MQDASKNVLKCHVKEKRKCSIENAFAEKSESVLGISGLVEGMFYTTNWNVHLYGFVSLHLKSLGLFMSC